MQTKLSIIIPVYNEARTVEQVLNLVWNKDIPEINTELLIVESNSTDDSRSIVTKFAEQKNKLVPGSVKILLQSKPEGKGKAVRLGLAAASGDIILIQDADMEYDVNDYPALIGPILEGRTNFVLGSRHLSAGGWKIRKFGKNQIRSGIMNLGGLFFHGLFNVLFGVKLTDPTTMYKVFKRDCLQEFDLVSNRFDFDFELLGKLIRSGNIPLEIPVSYVSRGFEDGKKIRVFRDPMTWLWAILKFRIIPLKAQDSTLVQESFPIKLEDASILQDKKRVESKSDLFINPSP